MRLYDTLMERLSAVLAGEEAMHYAYEESLVWPEHETHEMILQKEMAFELGGQGNPAVNITCVSSNEAFFQENEVIVYGSDLQEITEATPYARISFLLTEELAGEDTDTVYQTLQDIDFVKYHVYPKGYMIRTSGQSGREQVRVGKKELAQGMTFARIGNTFIQHYLATGKVKRAKVIFLTLQEADYKELEKIGFQASDIKNSLSKIKGGLPTECSVCDIREICNEVEGLRELHFGTKDKQKRGIQIDT